jgi:hypothetical protein
MIDGDPSYHSYDAPPDRPANDPQLAPREQWGELYAGGRWVSRHDFFADVPQTLWYNKGNFDNGGRLPQARVAGAC